MKTSYTADLAAAEPARSVRKAVGRVSRSPLLDAILRVLSVPWAALCVTVMIVGLLPVMPLFLWSVRRSRAANLSTEEGGSLTAVKTANGRAVAAASGFGPDRLAPRMIAEEWRQKLAAAGFDPALRTCLVWEGVTMYIGEAVVRQTLAEVRALPAGSVIGFDVVDADWALSPKMQSMTRRSGEPWLFGLRAGEERVWVEEQGLVVLDELRHEELLARYMPEDAHGRTLGACGDFGCLLLAGVPDTAARRVPYPAD